MGIRTSRKAEVIARLTANQKDIITNILTTRQRLRKVHSQRLKLQQAIQAKLDGGDKSNQSFVYERYLHAHNDLAQSLQGDLEILNKRLADTEVAMDRVAGPVHVEPWPEGSRGANGVIFQDMKRFLNMLHSFGVTLAAVFVFVAVFSILFLVGGPDSRLAFRKMAAADGDRGASEPLWNDGTLAMDKHRKHHYRREGWHRDSVAAEQTDDHKDWIRVGTARESEAILSGGPAITSIDVWNAVRRQAEIQEWEFLQYETGVRLAVGRIGPITWQEAEQYRLDWVRSRRRQRNGEPSQYRQI
ncbi:hypothetical protein DFP73DRAFT_629919 [Morchella snyderi]|nr:hypothetical protein DFP73DRAFT_629919 [Morchella snyderi]